MDSRGHVPVISVRARLRLQVSHWRLGGLAHNSRLVTLPADRQPLIDWRGPSRASPHDASSTSCWHAARPTMNGHGRWANGHAKHQRNGVVIELLPAADRNPV